MRIFISFMLFFTLYSLAADHLRIIPKVKMLDKKEGQPFTIKSSTKVYATKKLQFTAKLLQEDIEKSTGHLVELISSHDADIIFVEKESDHPEAYSLEVQADKILITGSEKGLFYASQSLTQLIQFNNGTVPQLLIKDQPRFQWRGMHLDVARHMFPVKDIKKFLRWMAYHKLNNFHWHLTEDQGWRIEIKKYPKLTQIGAWRRSTPPYGARKSDNHRKYGGYYSQEEIKEVVDYATQLHINVVPEIDMPGHMSAAIASYPELGNTDIQYYNPQVMNRWGVYPYILAPKEYTFQWIDDVLTEICEMFPSKYIHIGGDEAPKDQWEESQFAQDFIKKNNLKDTHELQSYFIKRLQKKLNQKGRKLIGWDEIREGGLSSDATVMSWRGEKGGISSAKEGHDVVMTPINFTYFDHYQAPENDELKKGKQFEAIGGFTPIEEIYSYNPVPSVLSPKEAKHILGTQAQLWSEYMKTWDKVEYMAFPRLAALSEVAWTRQKDKNFEEFLQGLKKVKLEYKRAGINYFK